MKILVTGGTGYIGAHTVVELVNAGHQPIIIDNLERSDKKMLEGIKNITGKELPFYQIDCTDAPAMEGLFAKEPGIEGVIHFAAYKAVGESVENPLIYYKNNIDSLLVLLNLMIAKGVKDIVFSSSCTVYGQPDKLPVTEDAAVKPAQSPYGNTKQICEEILKDAVASNAALKVLSLRYFNPIGAHPTAELGELPIGRPNNLVPYITQTAAGLRDKISILGSDYNTPDGTAIRDYIHVVDLAKAHVSAIEVLNKVSENNHYDFVNIGTGRGASVLEVVKAFEVATGQKLNYELTDRRPGDVEQVWAAVEKSTKLLGWKTELTLEDALADAWRWEKKIRNIS